MCTKEVSVCPLLPIGKNKISAGQTSDLVSGHWDMYNTFAELAHQEQSSPDGISLVNELLGIPQKQQHEYLYFEYPEKRGQVALRWGDWKGVKVEMKTTTNAPWELYNLKTDPQEKYNLAAKHPEIIHTMDSLQRRAHRHPHIREWEFIDPKFKK